MKLLLVFAALSLGACAQRQGTSESKPTAPANEASAVGPAAPPADRTVSGAASSAASSAVPSDESNDADPETLRVRALVAKVVALAQGKARGPALPIERVGSLLDAREHAGKTFVSADGTCLADDHVLSAQIGSGNAGDTRGACDPELLNPLAPEEGAETKPLRVTAARMLEVSPVVNFSYWQEVKVKKDKGGTCLARIGGISRFGLPYYSAAQELEYRHQLRVSAEGDTASYHLVKDPSGEVLWVDYSGRLARHAKEGPPRIALDIVPDTEPTCQRHYDLTRPLPHIAFGVTFRTTSGECHLEPLSSALCTLWGKPYRVVIDQFGGATLNYTIVKDELFRPQAEVAKAVPAR